MNNNFIRNTSVGSYNNDHNNDDNGNDNNNNDNYFLKVEDLIFRKHWRKKIESFSLSPQHKTTGQLFNNKS